MYVKVIMYKMARLFGLILFIFHIVISFKFTEYITNISNCEFDFVAFSLSFSSLFYPRHNSKWKTETLQAVSTQIVVVHHELAHLITRR